MQNLNYHDELEEIEFENLIHDAWTTSEDTTEAPKEPEIEEKSTSVYGSAEAVINRFKWYQTIDPMTEEEKHL